MHIHSYLIDFNNEGSLYRISIQGIKHIITDYLYGLSEDVRFVKTAKKKHKNDKGCRRLPCGTVVACTFEYDKLSTFSKFASKCVDARKAVVA